VGNSGLVEQQKQSLERIFLCPTSFIVVLKNALQNLFSQFSTSMLLWLLIMVFRKIIKMLENVAAKVYGLQKEKKKSY